MNRRRERYGRLIEGLDGIATNSRFATPRHQGITRHRQVIAWRRFAAGLASILILVAATSAHAQDDPPPSTPKPSIKVGRFRNADTDPALPKYEELELPSAEELLRAKPFDWIALKSLEALVVEPVEPRPDTLARLNSEYERYLKARGGFAEAEEVLKEKRRQLQRIQVSLMETESDQEPEYMLETKLVSKIDYFEDLVLRRANLLIDEGNISVAYDLLLLVDQRNRENNLQMTLAFETRKNEEATAKADTSRAKYTVPDPPPLKLNKSWPKFDETYQRLLLRDAQGHLSRGADQTALRLLETLWDQNRTYPELYSLLGRIVDKLITAAVNQSDFRQARHFLARLATREPEHSTVVNWKTELTNRTTAMIDAARTASTAGDASLASQLIDQAARIWPETKGLKEVHRELTERFQIVKVGVLRLPGDPANYPLELPAESEARSLTDQLLFEPIRVDERGVRYRSSMLETWEPTDLGREVQFNLRMKRAEWEASPTLNSADILNELQSRIDPNSAKYDERLAGSVRRVSVQSPSQFTIQFERLPLRLEALMQFSVGLGEESLAMYPDLPEAARPNAGRQRFFESERNEHQVAYRRVSPQSAVAKARHIDEVVTVRYESWDRALQGLLRGEVTAVPHVGLGDLKGLQDDNRFFVVPYALPASHFILFNPNSPPLRDGQLRRAVSLALPRDDVLRQTILANATEPLARISSTPFPSTSYGHNRLIAEPAYDPQRAAALTLTAKKQHEGQLPELRIACPPDPAIRAAVAAMIEHWNRVGIVVRMLDESSESNGNNWDMVYRTATIVEPLTALWPLLAVKNEATIDSLRPLPERVRRQLVDLERANDWTSATKLLRRIETELMVEVRYVPLWEVDEYFVTRRHLLGLPPRLMHPYQDLERWTLQSWYPQETP